MRYVFAVVLLMLAWSTPAEECMDCLEKYTVTTRNGNEYRHYEALCCDAPCWSGYTVIDEDVGAGCGVAAVDSESAGGTRCSSAAWDLGCPPPDGEEREPVYDDSGRDPDDSRESPIIIDLGGSGYALTSPAAGVLFDLRADGRPVRTAWTRAGAENAFLALDRNGNGRIDSGAELFGNHTMLSTGSVGGSGFEALAELDANGDGVVDAADPAWADLRLWTDRNHDGMSSAEELQFVASSALTGIETRHQRVGRRDQWGNEFRYMSHVRQRESSSDARRTYYDVFFRVAN